MFCYLSTVCIEKYFQSFGQLLSAQDGKSTACGDFLRVRSGRHALQHVARASRAAISTSQPAATSRRIVAPHRGQGSSIVAVSVSISESHAEQFFKFVAPFLQIRVESPVLNCPCLVSAVVLTYDLHPCQDALKFPFLSNPLDWR